ncbi:MULTISPECIES: hypothetical protein [unclassified Arthrobacter]|jgi:hypothetical protein|uniref:hypothetical protein n=1 Tax=unclassified Arthrobacter TaxID=235627 RepID=UPI00037BDAE4|nr:MULTISPECIES: hypothetical protein [unclassified Arthrobacter]BCW53501.1 hypothetical protein StoSoilB19_08750 [Arthrobacter sp. StoSoilB19]BCW74586.1 hypothetical protein NicSoilB11_09110 [Arthrobacter sp. NicSoilB11]
MTVLLRRAAIFSLAGLSILAGSAAPAQATNDAASCVGIIVSTQAQAGELDVNYFKDLADDEDAPNFGQFVQGGAHLHYGSMEACLPD